MGNANQQQAHKIWKAALQRLLDDEKITPFSHEQWFENAVAISMDAKSITIQAEDDFSRDWMRDNYHEILEQTFQELLGNPMSLYFQVKEVATPSPMMQQMYQETFQDTVFSDNTEPLSQPAQTPQPIPQQAMPQPQFQQAQPQQFQQMAPQTQTFPDENLPLTQQTQSKYHKDPNDQSQYRLTVPPLNPQMTFNNFVAAGSNQLAFTAALAVAKNPDNPHLDNSNNVVGNPLFIYGNSGLGKTHLVQAIGNEIRANYPDKVVLYVTSEAFLSEYVRSIQEKQPHLFREQFRSVDVLIIEDIQFVEGKSGVQEEFFHTFNHLYALGKNIILTSDSRPQDLTILTERLQSRFTGGLIIDVQPPEYETRMAILQKKIALLHNEEYVPNEVIEYIAQNIDTNVRELEGALNSLFARAVMLGEIDITLELAIDALKSYTKRDSKKVTIARIQKVVAKYFHITAEELKSKARKEPLATHRHIAVYMCKQMTENSLKQIGKQFGNRDHTTIMNSVRRVEDMLKKDPDIAAVVEELEKQINI